jgi:hypothetical protein
MKKPKKWLLANPDKMKPKNLTKKLMIKKKHGKTKLPKKLIKELIKLNKIWMIKITKDI